MTSRNVLNELVGWYKSQCNGDWEHTYGLTLDTADNPGWVLDIDLEETDLKDKPFTTRKVQRKQEDDWIHCSSSGSKYEGRGGTENLEEIISIFLDWANDESP